MPPCEALLSDRLFEDNQHPTASPDRFPMRAASGKSPIMSNTQEWLQRKTFHHSAFSDLKRMVERKHAQGLKISLCIPTFNEEATIGGEVRVFCTELMGRHALLDEVVVIDSGSTDRTVEVAREAGAEVHAASDILPEAGLKRGKGENLWKAIYQLKGDLIVYVDGDIVNIHPRFVYGLVGPLIEDPEICYVKGFYDRPLSLSSETRLTGGGRVTEILVRPLFSAFFPELSALVQPLSGEYAVRRSVLEAIPFPIGYGVEMSHILDVYNRWGMEAFAQVDLERRVHRNQTTAALGRMSFGILQVFFNRLKQFGLARELPDIGTFYRAVENTGQTLKLHQYEIAEDERPPMIELDAYRRKFGVGKRDE